MCGTAFFLSPFAFVLESGQVQKLNTLLRKTDCNELCVTNVSVNKVSFPTSCWSTKEINVTGHSLASEVCAYSDLFRFAARHFL